MHLLDDRIGGRGPLEGLAVRVVGGDQVFDALHELLGTGERTSANSFVGDEGEDALALVQPDNVAAWLATPGSPQVESTDCIAKRPNTGEWTASAAACAAKTVRRTTRDRSIGHGDAAAAEPIRRHPSGATVGQRNPGSPETIGSLPHRAVGR